MQEQQIERLLDFLKKPEALGKQDFAEKKVSGCTICPSSQHADL